MSGVGISSERQSQLARSNCAGRGCAERDGCRRYRVRIGDYARSEAVYWISADIERVVYGSCAVFMQYRGVL